jgi:hypothetical protein
MIAWMSGLAWAGPEVAVAARDLKPGDVIAAADLRAVEVPPESFAPFLTGGGDPALFVGDTVRERVLAGEVVDAFRVGRVVGVGGPAKGTAGVVAAGLAPGAMVDVIRPGQGGCRVAANAPVLRRGAGASLVQIPQGQLGEVLASDVAVAPADGKAPKCTGAAPPRSAPGRGQAGLVTVPALAADLPAGRVLTAADLVWVGVPAALAGTLAPDPVGGKLVDALHRGQLLTAARVTPGPADHGAPPTVLGTVRVPAQVGAPFWPGDRVGVVGGDGCLSLDGVVAGGAGARAPGLSVKDPGSPAWMTERAAQAGGPPGPALPAGELAVTATHSPGPGVVVWLPAEVGEGTSWCRAVAGAAVVAPSRPTGPPSLELRLLDPAGAPVVDAVVDHGPRAGAWAGQVRPDAGGVVPVPGDGPQVWVRVTRPGADPLVFGQRVTPGTSASVGVVVAPTGSCPPAPNELWGVVTKPFHWQGTWQLPAATGDWVRLEVQGPLVAERMLVAATPAADGGADLEVRGSGFGGGAGSRHVDAATWTALLGTVRGAVTSTPASVTPIRPTPICTGNGTVFRLEVGTAGKADGLLRDAFAPGSPEEAAVRAVLTAAGLDGDR